MRPMVLVVLAIAAALWGAPSSSSGADFIDVRAPQAGQPAAASGADSAPVTDGPMITPVGFAVGFGGIVTLVLLAWYVLAPRRRRRARPGSDGTHDDAPASPTAEEVATAALHRRTLRRAKVRLEEDPILASMGVGSAKRASKPGASRGRRGARRSPPT